MRHDHFVQEMITVLDKAWAVSQALNAWVHEKLEAIERSGVDEREMEEQGVQAVFLGIAALYKAYGEEPMTQAEFRQIWEQYKARRS